MNSACTNLVLDGFFALLACRKCKRTPDNPVRFVNCGDFFCDSCVENDTVCSQCKASVRPDEIRPYHTIAHLISYCKTIKEMMCDLDNGDLWGLANAIHQFTEQQSTRVVETESYENTAIAQENDTIRKDNAANSEPERLRISKQTNQRHERDDKQLENSSFELNKEIWQKCKSNLQPQVTSFVHSIKINQTCTERSELELEDGRFLHAKEIGRHETASAVRSQEIHHKSRGSELQQCKNLPTVRSVEICQKSKEIVLQKCANVSFVHSTQISQKRTEKDAESETPGYIDPTQFSPIHRESDYELDTPGYRDSTQSEIHQLDYSNVGSETPGYIGSSQVIQHAKKTNENPPSGSVELVRSKSWQSDMELEDEEEGDTDSYNSNSQTNRHDVLAQETLEMEVGSCEGKVIPESLDEDLQNEPDKLRVGNAKSSNLNRRSDELLDSNLLREIGRMRSRQRKTFPLSDCDNVTLQKLHRRLTESALDRQDKTPNENIDTLKISDVLDSFMDNNPDDYKQTAGRQLKWANSLGRNERTKSFDEINYINSSAGEKINKEAVSSKQLHREKETETSFEGESRVRNIQSRIPMTEDDTISITNVEITPSDNWDPNRQQRTSHNRRTMEISSFAYNDVENEKAAAQPAKKQLRRIRNLKFDRQDSNSIDRNPIDTRVSQNFASIMNDSLTERKAQIRSLNNCARVKNLAINRLHLDSMSDRDTLDLANGADLAETEDFEARYINEERDEAGSSQKCQINDISVANCETIRTENLQQNTPMRVVESVEKSLPRQLQRLTDWPLNRANSVEDSMTNVDKVDQMRPLRQRRRSKNPQPGHETLKVCDLDECDITNIQDFGKEQAAAPLPDKNELLRKKVSLKRASKSPPNDHPLAVVIAEQNEADKIPFKQLRSVENLEIDSQNKIPAKKPKAKVVQLKPRKKIGEKSATGPKVPPKNLNKRNTKGETALHTACVKGQDDYVKSLLEAGANPNTKDNANWTPLQEAVKLGRREICEMLLQFGASPNTPGIENRTALHDASENDKLEEAALLLRFNASRNVYDKYGNRPIDYAASDAMRTLLADDNAIEKTTNEAVYLNSTLDQSILTPNSKVVVLPSNLSTVNKKALTQIASKLKIAVASSFRPGITHIVVEANERNSTDLTYYVMLAILQGIWILNSQWIAISADLKDISEIDLELFEVHAAPNPRTPERSRMNEEKQNPRLFNNCYFFFTIGTRGTWKYGKLELNKNSLTNLVLAGQGEVLKREPDPEDFKDSKITPFHVANKPLHPLHRCSHYIIYMPGKDEPRIRYNMPHIKTLPLAWLLECIEKFALVDPILIGIS